MSNENILVPRFYRSSQPWEGPSHVSYRSPNIKLIVRPFSIPNLFKTHCYRKFFFFPFWGYSKTNLLHPPFHIGMWALYNAAFRFRFFRSALQTCV